MFAIVEKRPLVPKTTLYEVRAPQLAERARPGQFVIVRLHEYGERIPLSLAGFSGQEGTITLVVMAVGKTTCEFSDLEVGDSILDVVGPLGHPTPVSKVGNVVVVGGGFGSAPLLPIAQEFAAAGNRVTAIIGARNKSLLLFVGELEIVCDRVLVTTDDGSRGTKGVVTDALQPILEAREADLVMAVGPAVMMKFVSLATKPRGVSTLVSLNPIMIDGTGMCGGCRVSIDGETKFGCVDGPDFDGHKVDWDLLVSRQQFYLDEERRALDEYHKCKIGQPAPAGGDGGSAR